jgi:hypothetical protein
MHPGDCKMSLKSKDVNSHKQMQYVQIFHLDNFPQPRRISLIIISQDALTFRKWELVRRNMSKPRSTKKKKKKERTTTKKNQIWAWGV